MNKLSTLQASARSSAERPLSGSFSKYSGPWTIQQAAHLLRRSTFGPTRQMMLDAVNMGMDLTMDALFTPGQLPPRPLNYYSNNDPEVPIGNTWVTADVSPGPGLGIYRIDSINAWYLLKLQSEQFNILEKMVLFWHNHFVVSDIESPALFYNYFDTLEQNALGNFKELTKKITVNAGMLRYLNGNLNTKNTLNENYARELLELFTIGKGPLAGPGDYTTFTEQDVHAIAECLTGWSYTTPYQIIVAFDSSKHTSGSKQLSYRFNNTFIPNLGNLEYEKVIDVIFQQDECSRFIARKLYRWFVDYHITPEVETEIIEPMALMIRNDGYNISNALKTLLQSEHFFSEAAYGCMIKSPLDFIMSLSNALKFPVPPALNDYYTYFNFLWHDSKLMGQVISELPDVAGWKAYYQEPLYHRHWINSVSLLERKRYVEKFINSGFSVNSLPVLKIPVMTIVNALPDPSDINELLFDLSDLFYPYRLTASQYDILKDVVLNGLPDYEWNLEYTAYSMDPTNMQLFDAIDSKMRELFTVMLNFPEFMLH
ncbi:MAG: DUF1800 family protein [Saprospiraceae bacterium]